MSDSPKCCSPSQNIMKSNLKRPGFVLFGPNLTHFRHKTDIFNTFSLEGIKLQVSNKSDVYRGDTVRNSYFPL